MPTLEQVLSIQKTQAILQAPSSETSAIQTDTKPTLRIALQNNTTSSQVWAYITGLDLNRNNAVFLLSSDGVTPYHPASPSQTLAPLSQNCHIRLGAPGTTRTVTIPQLAGGRIWFSLDTQLTFLVNPGPALVEPSVMNPTDPNYEARWSFAEFTYNKLQLFANITYVDFVSVPISLALTSTDPAVPTQLVPGMDQGGLDAVCAQLVSQHGVDGADWDRLIIKTSSGENLRALSPNAAIKLFAPAGVKLFNGYYDPYVWAVWAKYTTTQLRLNTQAQWGVLTGTVSPSDKLVFSGIGEFEPPSTEDIFSCSTGSFAGYEWNTEAMGNITARLAAAFNRSTLLINPDQPDGEVIDRYYRDRITNHYSRIVHGVNGLGRGYAFPYDDVAPRDEDNVAGTVAGAEPGVFVVAVGGEAVIPRDYPGQGVERITQTRVPGEEDGSTRGWFGWLWWSQHNRRDAIQDATRDISPGGPTKGDSTQEKLTQVSQGNTTPSAHNTQQNHDPQKETKNERTLVTPKLSPPPESILPPGTEQASAQRMEAMADREADREAMTAAARRVDAERRRSFGLRLVWLTLLGGLLSWVLSFYHVQGVVTFLFGVFLLGSAGGYLGR